MYRFNFARSLLLKYRRQQGLLQPYEQTPDFKLTRILLPRCTLPRICSYYMLFILMVGKQRVERWMAVPQTAVLPLHHIPHAPSSFRGVYQFRHLAMLKSVGFVPHSSFGHSTWYASVRGVWNLSLQARYTATIRITLLAEVAGADPARLLTKT